MVIKVRKKPVIISGIIALIILLVTAGLVWFKWPYHQYEGIGMRPEFDVADNIVIAPGSQIFANAIYNTGYTTFLHGDGPYTVFVPIDSAYGNLSAETKSYLASQNNEGEARQVLLYHVVKGRYSAASFKEGMNLKTVQGEDLTLSRKGDSWVINGYSYIESPDIFSKNGVIHTTTNYLLPPSVIEQ